MPACVFLRAEKRVAFESVLQVAQFFRWGSSHPKSCSCEGTSQHVRDPTVQPRALPKMAPPEGSRPQSLERSILSFIVLDKQVCLSVSFLLTRDSRPRAAHKLAHNSSVLRQLADPQPHPPPSCSLGCWPVTLLGGCISLCIRMLRACSDPLAPWDSPVHA